MRRLSRSFSRPWSGAALTAAVVTALSLGLVSTARPAEAQEMFVFSSDGGTVRLGHPPRFEALLRPDFSRRDLPVLVETLALDEAQRLIIEMIIEEYRARWEERSAAFREARTRVEALRGPEPLLAGDGPGGEMPMIFVSSTPGDEEGGTFALALDDLPMGEGDGEQPTTMTITFATTIQLADDGAEGETPESAAGEDGESVEDAPPLRFRSGVEVDGDALLSEAAREALTAEVQARLDAQMDRYHAALSEALASHVRGEAEDTTPVSPEDLEAWARWLLAEKDVMREECLENLRIILNEQQVERLPAALQAVRRAEHLPMGQLSGERLDVHRLDRERPIGSVPELSVMAVLGEHAARLDAALVARERTIIETDIDLIEPWVSGDVDAQAALRRRVMDRRVAVRDENLQVVETLGEMMVEVEAEAWRTEANRRAFPRAFSRGRVDAAFRQALALEDLPAETREAIAALAAQHEATMAPKRERLRALLIEHEPEREQRLHERFRDGALIISSLPEPSPLMKAMAERFALQRKCLTQLRTLLGEERAVQVKALQRRPAQVLNPGALEAQGAAAPGGIHIFKPVEE